MLGDRRRSEEEESKETSFVVSTSFGVARTPYDPGGAAAPSPLSVSSSSSNVSTILSNSRPAFWKTAAPNRSTFSPTFSSASAVRSNVSATSGSSEPSPSEPASSSSSSLSTDTPSPPAPPAAYSLAASPTNTTGLSFVDSPGTFERSPRSRRTVSAAAATSRETDATVLFAACATRSFAARSVFHTSSEMSGPSSSSEPSESEAPPAPLSATPSPPARERRPPGPEPSPRSASSPPRRVLSDRSSASDSESESRSRSPTFFATSPTRAETLLKKSIAERAPTRTHTLPARATVRRRVCRAWLPDSLDFREGLRFAVFSRASLIV